MSATTGFSWPDTIQDNDVLIVSACRTPVGRYKGGLCDYTAPELGGAAVRACLSALHASFPDLATNPATCLDHVIMGHVLSAGCGQAPARTAGTLGDVPPTVPCMNVNKVCASGMEAIRIAFHECLLNESAVVIAGGMESMSRAPRLCLGEEMGKGTGIGNGKGMGMGKGKGNVEGEGERERESDSLREEKVLKSKKSKEEVHYGHYAVESLMMDGLVDAKLHLKMGVLAEHVAVSYGIGKKAQDEYALLSYQRAKSAWDLGHFSDQVCTVAGAELRTDEEPFRDPSKMGRLPLVFAKEYREAVDAHLLQEKGCAPCADPGAPSVCSENERAPGITAGNASTLADGAAACVLVRGDTFKEKFVSPSPVCCRILGTVSLGADRTEFACAPVAAIQRLLQKCGVGVEKVDLFEVNEAFSLVPVYVQRALQIPMSKLNSRGGAVSIGHPLGASGARIVVSLCWQLTQEKKRLGVAAICFAGGGATAILVENIME